MGHKANPLALFLIISVVSIVTHAGQALTREELNTDCVTLRMIQRKPAPKIKGKTAPDVIVTVPDDLQFRFKLKNTCDQTVYYLADTISEDRKSAAGFFIYRKKGEDWRSRFPEWRRERTLTDPYTYHWLPLKTGESVEFEFSDLSLIEGERSVAIYINDSPSHKNRVELMAEPFSIDEQRVK